MNPTTARRTSCTVSWLKANIFSRNSSSSSSPECMRSSWIFLIASHRSFFLSLQSFSQSIIWKCTQLSRDSGFGRWQTASCLSSNSKKWNTFDRALAISSLINNEAVSCEVGFDANRLAIFYSVLCGYLLLGRYLLTAKFTQILISLVFVNIGFRVEFNFVPINAKPINLFAIYCWARTTKWKLFSINVMLASGNEMSSDVLCTQHSA